MNKEFDLVDSIMAYEDGELNNEGTLNLFAHLIKTRQAWSLQGAYGRTAHSLIENDYITADGELTEKSTDAIKEE